LAKVEVDEGENMKLAGRYRLRGFPTIMLFRAGEELGRFSGARASHWIEDWIEQHLAPERI
jgi:putative thioredoxin